MPNEATPQHVRDRVTSLFAKGAFEEGLKMLDAAGSSLPETTRLECVGNWHFYRRELQAAIDHYESAITLMPDYYIARYQYLVGVQHEKAGELLEAFDRYQNAIEIEPTFVDAYQELGGLLGKCEDYEGALQCYRDAARLQPDDLANWANLRNVLTKLVQQGGVQYGAELGAARDEYDRRASDVSSSQLEQRRW